MDKLPDRRRSVTLIKAASVGTSIATGLAGTVLGGFFLGKYFDLRWGTTPWLELVFTLIGLVLGGSYVVVTLKRLGMDNDKS